MTHKITFLTASVILALLASMAPRAYAQTYEKAHASTVILAGNATDPINTATIVAPALSGAFNFTLPAATLTFPGTNASGILTNPGTGILTWTPLSYSSFPNEAAVTLLGNPTGSSASTTTIVLGSGLGFTTGPNTLSNTGVISIANGGGISVSASTGAITLNSTATNLNTASAIVARDASGNFSAGTITAALSGNATSATNIATTLQAASASTFYPTFVPLNATNASQAANVATALSYVPSTGTLSATNFSGAFSGNATTATTATNFSGSLTGDVTGTQGATVIANAGAAGSTAGSHIIAALTDNAGTLTNSTSGNAATATAIATTLQTASASTFYPTFVPSNTTATNQAADVATGLSYVPSTGTLSATTFSGALSGNATGFTGSLAGDVTGPQGTTAINNTAAAGNHIVAALNVATPTTPINVAAGGSGVATRTVHSIQVGNGTSAVTQLATGNAGQILTSAGSGADPAWTTATYPTTTTASSLLYSNGANVVAALPTVNGGVLNTNSTGVPSITATPTLGVAGTTAGSLALAGGSGAFTTTIQPSTSAQTSNFIYQLPTQGATAPTSGQVLTAGTPTGSSPNFTVPLSWITPSGAVTSVSNADGSLTLSPTTGAVVGSLAINHANGWTAQQTFTNSGSSTAALIASNTFNSGATDIALTASTTNAAGAAVNVTSGNVRIAGLTTNQVVMTDASKNLTSAGSATTVVPNTILAGPSSGVSNGAATFRALVAADLPAGSNGYIQNQYSAQTSAGFNITAGAPVKAVAFTEATILNDATDATANAAKTGLALSSTGTWTGAGAGTNTGLTLNVTGGTTNTDITGTSVWSVTSAGAGTFGALTTSSAPATAVADLNVTNTANVASAIGEKITVSGGGAANSGLNFAVTGGTANTDITGTSSNWSVSSAGLATLAGLTMPAPGTEPTISTNTIDMPIGSASYFKITAAAADNLDGIAGGADGRVVILVNVGSNNITVNSDDVSHEGTPANEIHLVGGNGNNLILAPDGIITLIYDSGISRWRVLSSK